MRQLLWVIFCTAAMAATTACGSSGASTGASQTTVFPVTITRTGGVAGFQDVLVVSGDGLVKVTQKGRAPWQCRLTPDAARRLTKAVSEMPWPRITPGSTSASFPDDLVTMVSSPAGGPIRLEDPLVGVAGQIFNELVSDLNGGRSASGMCTPL